MNRLLSYEEKNTPLHRLSGVTKLVFFLLWCLTSALTYDTRVLLVMVGISLVLYVLSGTTWQQVRSVFAFVMVFMVLNLLAIFILSPYQGTAIYGSKTILSPFLPGHALTREELFYLFNVRSIGLYLTGDHRSFRICRFSQHGRASLYHFLFGRHRPEVHPGYPVRLYENSERAGSQRD